MIVIQVGNSNLLCAGGCGAQNLVQHRLFAETPEVFTMQLAWQTASASRSEIKAALLGLREVNEHHNCVKFGMLLLPKTRWHLSTN